MRRLEEEEYRCADAVVATGRSLARYLVRQRKVHEEKITAIGQGADLTPFSTPHGEPADFADQPRPRLIWLGVLAKADPELIAAALSALPADQGSLTLIGPEAAWARELADRDGRVRVLGPRVAEDAAAYFQHADIGLMLYDRERDFRQYEGQNPLELYEMAAARFPIKNVRHLFNGLVVPTSDVEQLYSCYGPLDCSVARLNQEQLS